MPRSIRKPRASITPGSAMLQATKSGFAIQLSISSNCRFRSPRAIHSPPLSTTGTPGQASRTARIAFAETPASSASPPRSSRGWKWSISAPASTQARASAASSAGDSGSAGCSARERPPLRAAWMRTSVGLQYAVERVALHGGGGRAPPLRAAWMRTSVGLQYAVERVALHGGAAGGMRRADQVLDREHRAVVGARHPADRLLHQRPTEVVDAPAKRLGGGVEPHLHPARLEVADAVPERQAEDGRVLEVLLARDLLDAVGAAQHRVKRDERERHELGDAAGTLLERADHAHVLGELPGLLDVAEHDSGGGAQPGRVRGLDDLHPPLRGQLVRRDALTDAVVQHLGRGPRSGPQAGLGEALEHRARRQAGHLAHVVDLHRRVRVEVHVRGGLLRHAQPVLVVLEAPVGMDPRLHADLGGPELDGVLHAPHEILARVLVRVGRAAPLAEPAERAADDADVRHVDVAVHDEGHLVARQLRAQLVSGLAHVLDRLRPRLREERGELLLAEPLAVVPLRDGPRDEIAADGALLAPARPAPRDERPVLQLDHVEHALLEPFGVHVLRVDAE